ncbi:MAG: LPD29 domain-containing protein [Lachnospira eligens]
MRYFKNVRSYKELKETYRDLLKKNHPDNGGNLETMQEINQEYDIAFRIWKNKDQTITEEEKKETAQGTRRNFYTAFGWEGSRYDSNLTLKEIAVIVRKYVKEKYPTCKFSVRTSYASMCQELHVEIKEFADKMYKTAEDLRAEGLHEVVDGWDRYRDNVSDMMKKLRANGYFNLDCWLDEDVYNAYEKAVADSTFYAIKSDYFRVLLMMLTHLLSHTITKIATARLIILMLIFIISVANLIVVYRLKRLQESRVQPQHLQLLQNSRSR